MAIDDLDGLPPVLKQLEHESRVTRAPWPGNETIQRRLTAPDQSTSEKALAQWENEGGALHK